MALRQVCVFCGSASGRSPRYGEQTRALAAALAARGLGVVYGGASVGLMGELADAALAGGAEVTGVIPRGLVRRELAHPGLTRLHTVETMHERKARMFELSDAFVALPGGVGTLDELFEIITWAQLGIHAKPVGLLDVDGYFVGLVRWLEEAVVAGFVRPERAASLVRAEDPDELLDRFAAGPAAPALPAERPLEAGGV